MAVKGMSKFLSRWCEVYEPFVSPWLFQLVCTGVAVIARWRSTASPSITMKVKFSLFCVILVSFPSVETGSATKKLRNSLQRSKTLDINVKNASNSQFEHLNREAARREKREGFRKHQFDRLIERVLDRSVGESEIKQRPRETTDSQLRENFDQHARERALHLEAGQKEARAEILKRTQDVARKQRLEDLRKEAHEVALERLDANSECRERFRRDQLQRIQEYQTARTPLQARAK